MSDESRDTYRLRRVEEQTKENTEDIASIKERVLLVETKEAGREKKSNRAMQGVIAIAVAISSGIAVALFSGSHP